MNSSPPSQPAAPPKTSQNLAQLDSRFRLIEHSAGLLRYEVDGWRAWPLLQYGLFSRFAALPSNPTAAASRLTARQRWSFAARDLARLAALPRAEYVVMVQSSNRAEMQGDRYKDIYFDDLLPRLGSHIKIENLVNRHYLPRSQAALFPSQLTTAGINLLVGALMKTGRPSGFKPLAAELSRVIASNFALDEYTPRRLELAFQNFYWSKRIYRRILAQVRPRAVLLTTAESYVSVVAAAKELGIRVVEFQHGLINRHHTAYSWTHNALPYKPTMPLPDQIFVYGDYWRDELLTNGFWGAEIRPVGSLRLEQYRRLPHQKDDQVFTILVTTQNMDTLRVVQFLADFLNLARGQLNLRLVIKLHPVEATKSYYESLAAGDEQVTVLMGSEPPSTFELLLQADLHLSIYSTCHYEALGLGVPTAILPFTNHAMVAHLAAAGDAALLSSPQDLLQAIQAGRFEPVSPQTRARYFSAHPAENMLRELGVA